MATIERRAAGIERRKTADRRVAHARPPAGVERRRTVSRRRAAAERRAAAD